MTKVHCLFLPINETTQQWAKAHYPQFWQQNLGEKKRTSYLLSRALLLHTLTTYYQLTQLPEMSYNSHQKPAFKNSNIRFNLTHSSDFVGLIITDESIDIGIDIERIVPRRNFSGLLQRTFTPIEIEWILQSSTTPSHPFTHRESTQNLQIDEQIRFFLLWSAKEAYLKADGRGLQGLSSLLLNPQQSSMNGDLKDGLLLLATLTAANALQSLNSLALYLPSHKLSELSIQTLAITDSLQARYHPLSISWRYQLLEQIPHLPVMSSDKKS